MTRSQINHILGEYGFSANTEISTDIINKIITDLENPIFVDKNTRLYFYDDSHLISQDIDILKVYYKYTESEPDFMIPFSSIYGFEFKMYRRED